MLHAQPRYCTYSCSVTTTLHVFCKSGKMYIFLYFRHPRPVYIAAKHNCTMWIANNAPYTNKKYADMHLIYSFCNENATSAVAEYQRLFPGQRVPNKQIFMAVHRHLRETGVSFLIFIVTSLQTRWGELCCHFECCLHQSDERISSQLDVLYMSLWQALHFESLYPYHSHPTEHLELRGYDVRLQFFRWIIAHLELWHLIFAHWCTIYSWWSE